MLTFTTALSLTGLELSVSTVAMLLISFAPQVLPTSFTVAWKLISFVPPAAIVPRSISLTLEYAPPDKVKPCGKASIT